MFISYLFFWQYRFGLPDHVITSGASQLYSTPAGPESRPPNRLIAPALVLRILALMGRGSTTAAWRLGRAGQAEPFLAVPAGTAPSKRVATVLVWRDYGACPRLIL